MAAAGEVAVLRWWVPLGVGVVLAAIAVWWSAIVALTGAALVLVATAEVARRRVAHHGRRVQRALAVLLAGFALVLLGWVAVLAEGTVGVGAAVASLAGAGLLVVGIHRLLSVGASGHILVDDRIDVVIVTGAAGVVAWLLVVAPLDGDGNRPWDELVGWVVLFGAVLVVLSAAVAPRLLVRYRCPPSTLVAAALLGLAAANLVEVWGAGHGWQPGASVVLVCLAAAFLAAALLRRDLHLLWGGEELRRERWKRRFVLLALAAAVVVVVLPLVAPDEAPWVLAGAVLLGVGVIAGLAARIWLVFDIGRGQLVPWLLDANRALHELRELSAPRERGDLAALLRYQLPRVAEALGAPTSIVFVRRPGGRWRVAASLGAGCGLETVDGGLLPSALATACAELEADPLVGLHVRPLDEVGAQRVDPTSGGGQVAFGVDEGCVVSIVVFERPNAEWMLEERRLVADLAALLAEAVGAERDRERLRVVAAAAEREMLAQDLHDSIGQGLASLVLQLEPLARLEVDPERARALAHARCRLGEVAEDLRRRTHLLRESVLGDRTLAEALDELREQLSAEGGPELRLEVGAGTEGLDDLVQDQLWCVVLEAVANAQNHAVARRLEVRLDLGRTGAARLEINNDGERELPGGGGIGLIGMAERVERLGGSFVSGPGEQWTWTVLAEVPPVPIGD